MNIYNFTAKNNQHQMVSLQDYAGKVLLIVNTATRCGLTPQYRALQSLYETYHDQGFEILDFPCNQFLEQAPEDDAGIENFCTLNYQTTFPRFAKITVNGEAADPLYKWLKAEKPHDEGDEDSIAFMDKVKAYTPHLAASDIRWNFGKFLIDRQGNVVARYAPAVTPDKLDAAIQALL